MIHFVVTAAQDHSIRDYLARRGEILAGRLDVLHYENLPDCPRFERGTYILSALEYLSPPMLSLVTAIHSRLARTEGFHFLNDPARTLRRFGLLRELERRGFNPFRAVRAGDDLAGLSYPVFLRAERSHDGAVSPLLRSAREVETAIGRALLAGRRIEDLLVVEFCDTADVRGYYRKYGAFIVGDSIIPRRLDYGRAWMLKRQQSEFSAAMGLEELEYVRDNPHEAALREIADLAAVGYGCIDYGIKDGRIVVWEINLAPTMGPARGDVRIPKTPEYRRIHAETGEVYHPRLREAFEALDLPAAGAAVEVDIDPALVRAARASANGLPRSGGGWARFLGRTRPLLEPLAAPVLLLFGRVARRRARPGAGGEL
ncbi:MAG TPA: hypothetical protein VFH11_09225 [Gemmatimonadota bacterium]|nr:hypothetical protein [Gemmatimonadota bacterium]